MVSKKFTIKNKTIFFFAWRIDLFSGNNYAASDSSVQLKLILKKEKGGKNFGNSGLRTPTLVDGLLETDRNA